MPRTRLDETSTGFLLEVEEVGRTGPDLGTAAGSSCCDVTDGTVSRSRSTARRLGRGGRRAAGGRAPDQPDRRPSAAYSPSCPALPRSTCGLVAAFRDARATGDPLMAGPLALPRGQGSAPGRGAGVPPRGAARCHRRPRGPGCWPGSHEPGGVRRRGGSRRGLRRRGAGLASAIDDPALTADVLDAALLAHWGPDDFAERIRLAARLEVSAHLADPAARLTAHLWRLTTAWSASTPWRCVVSCAAWSCSTPGPAPAGLLLRTLPARHARARGRRPRPRRRAPRRGRHHRRHPGRADVEAVVHSIAADPGPPAGDVTALRTEAATFEAYGDAGSSRSWRRPRCSGSPPVSPTAPDRSSTGCRGRPRSSRTSTSS